MSRSLIVGVIALISGASLAPKALVAQGSSEIQGAWIFADEGEQRGLFVFTDSHYSMMFVRGDSGRATYPTDRSMSDAETLVAYRSITANSGRYSITGDQLTVEAYMANDPNYMAGWPENAWNFTVEISGDTMTWKPAGMLGVGETVVLRRVE